MAVWCLGRGDGCLVFGERRWLSGVWGEEMAIWCLGRGDGCLVFGERRWLSGVWGEEMAIWCLPLLYSLVH